jgi:SAM-dependent methyltransferase
MTVPQFKTISEALDYHKIRLDDPAFDYVVNNLSVIGADEKFLDHKEGSQRRDLIVGEYLFLLHKQIGIMASEMLKKGQWTSSDQPDWFDHRHHTMNWEKESKNSWTESVSLVLRLLPRSGRLLNLCAGDCFFDGHFLAEATSEITCVDINGEDPYKNFLIKRNASDKKINYLFQDVLKYEPNQNYYDVVWMRSAIEHFSFGDQVKLYKKIKKSLKSGGWFCGDTPANPEKYNQKQHSAHENEWADEREAKDSLSEFFDEVHTYSLYSEKGERSTIFWYCR